MNHDAEQFMDDVADIAAGRPTTDDVLQQNFQHPAVPVRIADPVQVQTLPFLSGASRNVNITTSAEKILNDDPRRARALIVSDSEFYISPDKSAVTAGTAAKWPALEPLEIRSTDAWYVATVTGTGNISAINDQWAD